MGNCFRVSKVTGVNIKALYSIPFFPERGKPITWMEKGADLTKCKHMHWGHLLQEAI
jgi:hypothetical protein